MKTRSEIEQAIKELPTAEARQLAGWFNKYLKELESRRMLPSLPSPPKPSMIVSHHSATQCVTNWLVRTSKAVDLN